MTACSLAHTCLLLHFLWTYLAAMLACCTNWLPWTTSVPCILWCALPTVPLIATHLLTFALVPSTMWVFHTRANSLKSAGAQDPLMAIIGLSFLMVSIAGEIGWHGATRAVHPGMLRKRLCLCTCAWVDRVRST